MRIESKVVAIIAVGLLALSRTGAADHTVQVGATAITIPVPQGFAVVTPEMAALDTFLESLVPQTNERLLSLVSTEVAESPEENQFEKLDRMLGIQTLRKGITRTVSSAEFVKVKESVTIDSSKTFAQVKKKLGGVAKEIAGNLEENLGTKLDLKVGEIVPLPAHYETERAVSYSIISKTSVTAPGDNEPAEDTSITTVTMLHVKARLLCLYVGGRESDLEWTRTLAREWTEAIIQANPSDATVAKLEAAPAREGASISGLRGGIVGGLTAALIMLLSRSFKSNDKWFGAKSDDKWLG
jgi:hypothetical protein